MLARGAGGAVLELEKFRSIVGRSNNNRIPGGEYAKTEDEHHEWKDPSFYHRKSVGVWVSSVKVRGTLLSQIVT